MDVGLDTPWSPTRGAADLNASRIPPDPFHEMLIEIWASLINMLVSLGLALLSCAKIQNPLFCLFQGPSKIDPDPINM